MSHLPARANERSHLTALVVQDWQQNPQAVNDIPTRARECRELSSHHLATGELAEFRSMTSYAIAYMKALRIILPQIFPQ
jgi:hypothetical protein